MSFANFIDDVGTNGIFGVRLPEIGLSEYFNGGKGTQKTGTTPFNSTAASIGLGVMGADSTSQAYLNATRPSNTTTRNQTLGTVNGSGNEGIYDPYGIYAAGSAGGGAASSYNPADIAYLDDQRARLEAQQRSADTALNNGLTQLQDSYNKEVSGANSRRSQALADLNTKREDTTRAKDSAITRVNDNARTLAEGLRRRLGLASGSGSSAYQFAAPGAVSTEASKNRSGVLENFGMNFRDLDTTEQRQKSQFEELLADIEAQRKSRESDFRSGILEKKNQIDNSLSEVARQKALTLGGGYAQAKAAMQPYSSAIDSRQAEIDNLFSKFRTPYSIKAIDTSAPSLRDYMVDRANIKAQQPGPQDPTAAYNDPFNIKKQDELVSAY